MKQICSQNYSVSWVSLLNENVQQYLQYQHQCAADTMLISQDKKHAQKLHVEAQNV